MHKPNWFLHIAGPGVGDGSEKLASSDNMKREMCRGITAEQSSDFSKPNSIRQGLSVY